MNQKIELIARPAQSLELDRLAKLLGEVHDAEGEISLEWLAHYIGGRREQLAARIAHLRAVSIPATSKLTH
jgi:hypothetical protein